MLLLRQSIYSRLAGYIDVNDAERLCVEPAMRYVVGGRASQPEKQAASTSEVGRFEAKILSTKENLGGDARYYNGWHYELGAVPGNSKWEFPTDAGFCQMLHKYRL